MKYDFLAIGDVVTDEFIRIAPDSAEIIEGKQTELCFRFGDKIPYERAIIVPAVGNSANAAVAASRLGLSTAFISNIGDDKEGEDILRLLTEEGVDTRFVHKNRGVASNYHYVLWFKDDRTILIRHENYEYHMPPLDPPRWIYFSSSGERSLRFHDEVAEFVRQHPETNLAFQPGTYQMKFGADRLKNVYRATALFLSNREEAQRILKHPTKKITELIAGMHELGPRMVVITDGVKGAYASDGKTIWFMPNYPDPKPPFERTGAGDAFSSTLTTALALGKSIAEALMWAPINSMSVVQYVGAQEGLLRRSQLEKYLADAPQDYKPRVFANL